MAYKRRYVRKRYKRKPKAWYNKSVGTPKSLAMAAWKGVKRLKGLVNAEMCHFDLAVNSSPVVGTSVIFQLDNIGQGDQANQRRGDSLLIRGLNVNVVIKGQSGSANATMARFMIVQDTQQIASTTPAVTDILTSDTPTSLLNLNTVGRFKILWNKEVCLSGNGASNHCQLIRKYFNLYHHVRYNGTASTTIQKGGLYCVLMSDEASNTPTFFGTIRLNYHDN